MIHMDLLSPVTTPNMNGSKYTLVMIVEFSRYTLVFFLKAKSGAAGEIINLIKRIKRSMELLKVKG